ncbi:hypothetical protein AZI87_16815 [Bdellovibrio bacteriovorus]|uniref:Uncharacterized protein n=1 Tax=Bdellovibrio bacteriovorus TaxID=959 RepID=A0A162G077_BDEBC|nr:hypothetical protein [Bdellovibrio bacteriovorus]KYG62925.1 hypothetical protein AZI87_16815 [Bdellovibrio bacteriovorus]
MNSEVGAFALRQVLASTAVVGPILILIGLCYYLFKQDKRSVLLYLCAGVVCTVVGAICLYSEFRAESGAAPEVQRAAK